MYSIHYQRYFFFLHNFILNGSGFWFSQNENPSLRIREKNKKMPVWRVMYSWHPHPKAQTQRWPGAMSAGKESIRTCLDALEIQWQTLICAWKNPANPRQKHHNAHGFQSCYEDSDSSASARARHLLGYGYWSDPAGSYTYMHTCKHACNHTSRRAYMHTCIRA